MGMQSICFDTKQQPYAADVFGHVCHLMRKALFWCTDNYYVNEEDNMSVDQTKYSYAGVIGEGYFCVVKQYRRISDGASFACKELRYKNRLNPDYQYRLAREIEMARDLSECEQIIDVVDYKIDHDSNEVWYLMPMADANLYSYIKSNNTKLSAEDRFHLIKQVIQAMSYAHDRSWLHRDLSPHNVLVFYNNDQLPKIVVSDFGLGKNAESLSYYTQSGEQGYGAPLYVSPEQKEDLNKASVQSDIYSIGKLMFFIMTGRDPMDNYSCLISTIVYRCIEEQPDKRYPDLRSLSAHLDNIERISADMSFPIETTTMNDYLLNTKEFEWDTFHLLAVKGLHHSHPFHDYIKPIVTFLNDKPSMVKHYCEFAARDLSRFIDTFIKALDEIDKILGWPFSFMSDIGRFLSNIYRFTNDNHVKLSCLNRLWRLGFISDQWSVQDILLELLATDVPDEIVQQFASAIGDSPRELDVKKICSRKISQYPIKHAMLECHRKAKMIKDEKRKMVFADEDYI